MHRIHHSFIAIIITITFIVFSYDTRANDNNPIKGTIISDINPENINVYYLKTLDGIPIFITDENFITSHPEYNWLKKLANTDKSVLLTGILEENEEGEFQFKNNQFALVKDESIHDSKDIKYIYNSPLNNYFMKCEKGNPEFVSVGQFLNDIIRNHKNNGKEVKIDTKQISPNRYRFDMLIYDPMNKKSDTLSIGYNLEGNIAYMSYLKANDFSPETKMDIMEFCTRLLFPYYEKYKGNIKN